MRLGAIVLFMAILALPPIATAQDGFELAWGEDVVQGGLPATFEVCTVAAQCQAGTLNAAEAGTLRPQDVAVGPDGNVYVLDASHNTSRVQVFTRDGAFVRAFGRNVEPGDPQSPDVRTVAANWLYVGEGAGYRVSRLDTAGAF